MIAKTIKVLKQLGTIGIILLTYGCLDRNSIVLDKNSFGLIATNISPDSFDEDTPLEVTLEYSTKTNQVADACDVKQLLNLTIVEECHCDGGVCKVKVLGTSDYFGEAGFTYLVSASGMSSNSAIAKLTITPVQDAPVANYTSTTSLIEDTESVVNLGYSDIDDDKATSCVVDNLANVTISTACSCNSTTGICSVGLTGDYNYHGAASFRYQITAGGITSNLEDVSLTVQPQDDIVDVEFFPAQDLILPEDSIVGDVVSEVASSYYLFHRTTAPAYSIVTNTANNNFSITSDGILKLDSLTSLVANNSYSITVRAQKQIGELLYRDEKVVSIKVISSSEIAYIDPDFAGSEDGSRLTPYNSWSEALADTGSKKYLLQKRGTIATVGATLNLNNNDITMGSYGDGARPVYNCTVPATRCIDTLTYTGFSLRDLHIKSMTTNNSVIEVRANTSGSTVKILNNIVEGDPVAAQLLGIIGTQGILIQNNELRKASGNGIYVTGAVTDLSLKFNYIHQVNQLYNTDPATSNGRILHLNNAIANLEVAYNVFDRSDTGKGYIIFSTAAHTDALFSYNYIKADNSTFRAIDVGHVVYGIALELGSVSTDQIQFIGNKFENLENSLRLTRWSNTNIHSNEFYKSTNALRFANDVGGNISNNLFKANTVGNIYFSTSSSSYELSVRNNIFDSAVLAYNAYPARISLASNNNLYSNPSLIMTGYATLTDWQLTGRDAEAEVGEPDYYDGSNDDFHLISSSQGVSMGLDLGLDFDIESVPYGVIPHVGPYQMLK